VHALFEVPLQRKAHERPARRDELHARAQAALYERDVRAREVLEQVVHVRADLEAFDARQRLGFDARPHDHDHPEIRHLAPHVRRACAIFVSRCLPTDVPPTTR
jgi:hypothetical protein